MMKRFLLVVFAYHRLTENPVLSVQGHVCHSQAVFCLLEGMSGWDTCESDTVQNSLCTF